MATTSAEIEKLTRERDLYLRILEMGDVEGVEPLLSEALSLAVEVADAHHGYLELHGDGGAPRWSLASGLSDPEVNEIREAISRGIIAEAVATGRTVTTPSALLDPRFGARESVQSRQIGAVMCVPIGGGPPRGVLYLHVRDRHEFSDSARIRIEAFARHIAPLVDRVLARVRDHEASDATSGVRARMRLDGVIGRSPALSAVLEKAALVAPLEVTVLLTGASGTGKSQLARVIHDNSPRAAAPFVDLNCAAIPEDLLESELFGAMPGAHSAANRRIDGKISAAEKGTLFLDEIGDLTVAAQPKLLQLLQSNEYYPLGGTKPQRADVRILAATNTDLEQAVAAREFREDLFYRLQVLPVRVPSLAERLEDIAELVQHFCTIACDRHRLPRLSVSPNAISAAEAAEWPGNVRQLAHAVEAAAILAAGTGAAQIEVAHLFPSEETQPPGASGPLTFQEATRRFQADLLRRALEENGWNVVETARRLDVARSHVYNLIKAFGIKRSH